ncbi:histone-lysine N-methyltransferase 2B isoform X2 [Pleurodeles waltl]
MTKWSVMVKDEQPLLHTNAREPQARTKAKEPQARAKAREMSAQAETSEVQEKSAVPQTYLQSNKHLLKRARTRPRLPSKEETLGPPPQKPPWKEESSNDSLLASVSVNVKAFPLAGSAEHLPLAETKLDCKLEHPLPSVVANTTRRKRQRSESKTGSVIEIPQPKGRTPSSRRGAAHRSPQVIVQTTSENNSGNSISTAVDCSPITVTPEHSPVPRRKKMEPPKRVQSKASRGNHRRARKEAKCPNNPPVVLKFVSKAKMMKPYPLVKECRVVLRAPLPSIGITGIKRKVSQDEYFLHDSDRITSAQGSTVNTEGMARSEPPVKEKTSLNETNISPAELIHTEKQPIGQTIKPESPLQKKEEGASPGASPLLDVPQEAEEPAISLAEQPFCAEPQDSLAGLLGESATETLPASLETRLLLRRSSRGRHPPSPLETEMATLVEKQAPVASQTPEKIQAVKASLLKKIRKFIMPIVSARSSRVIKPPRRFRDDEQCTTKKSPPKASPDSAALDPKAAGSTCSPSLDETLVDVEDYAENQEVVERGNEMLSHVKDECSTKPEVVLKPDAILDDEPLQALAASPYSDNTQDLTLKNPCTYVDEEQLPVPLASDHSPDLTELSSSVNAHEMIPESLISDDTRDLTLRSSMSNEVQLPLALPSMDNQQLTAVCFNADDMQALTPGSSHTNSEQIVSCVSPSIENTQCLSLKLISPNADDKSGLAPASSSTDKFNYSALESVHIPKTEGLTIVLPSSDNEQSLPWEPGNLDNRSLIPVACVSENAQNSPPLSSGSDPVSTQDSTPLLISADDKLGLAQESSLSVPGRKITLGQLVPDDRRSLETVLPNSDNLPGTSVLTISDGMRSIPHVSPSPDNMQVLTSMTASSDNFQALAPLSPTSNTVLGTINFPSITDNTWSSATVSPELVNQHDRTPICSLPEPTQGLPPFSLGSENIQFLTPLSLSSESKINASQISVVSPQGLTTGSPTFNTTLGMGPSLPSSDLPTLSLVSPTSDNTQCLMPELSSYNNRLCLTPASPVSSSFKMDTVETIAPESLMEDKTHGLVSVFSTSETTQGVVQNCPALESTEGLVSAMSENIHTSSQFMASMPSTLPEKRKTILRQPTFRWNSPGSINSDPSPPVTQTNESNKSKTILKFPPVSVEEAQYPSLTPQFSQPDVSQHDFPRSPVPQMTQSFVAPPVVSEPSIQLPTRSLAVLPSLPLLTEVAGAPSAVTQSSVLKQDSVALPAAPQSQVVTQAPLKQPSLTMSTQPKSALVAPGKSDSSKRPPLLRAPQFTPSEAHLKIYESVSIAPQRFESKQTLDSSTFSASSFALRHRRAEPKSGSAHYLEGGESEHRKDSALVTVQDQSCHLPSDLVGTFVGKPQTVARTNHLSLPLFAGNTLDNEVATDPGLIKIQAMDCPGVIRKVALRRGVSSANSVPGKLTHPGKNSTPSSSEDSSDFDEAMSPASLLDLSPDSDEETALATPLSSMDEKMINILKTAQAQLSQIDKRSLRKLVSPGPRIKHVCRHASVALGQPRTPLTEDVPRLSALPLRDRDIIDLPLQVNESSSGSESESIGSHRKTGKAVAAARPVRPLSGRKKLRQGRCGRCKGCLNPVDCGKCINCLDKTKFGGPNTKKQCCVHRRCDRIVARRNARLAQKAGRGSRTAAYRESSDDTGDEEVAFWKKECEETATETSEQDPLLQRKSARRCVKQRPCYDVFAESEESEPDSKLGTSTRKSSRESDYLPVDTEELSRPRKATLQPVVHLKARKKPDKDLLAALTSVPLSNSGSGRLKASDDGIHRVRIDFKEDCDVENVWQLGGLSVLTSVPVTPQLMCLLCASRGHHELIYCQVCCEPFHQFCLEENERPLPEQEENWCCRRCKFCHVCGLKGRATKHLLECDRCRNCYHLDCLGPNYPTKPFRKRNGWLCSTCVRCKSCGVSPGKNWDTEWSNDYTLCPECTTLYDKGNYCPICTHCYEENDYESQMIHCFKCQHWVHSKCEGLTDEQYEILSNLPESVVYTCTPCTGGKKAKWRDVLVSELQSGLKQVMKELLTSNLTTSIHQCAKNCCGEEAEEQHKQPCDLLGVSKLLDQGHYVSVKSFCDDVVHIIQQRVNEESKLMDTRVSLMSQTLFLQLITKYFTWFQSQDIQIWQRSKSIPNGMLPNAVLPPSSDHIYAQWREREELHPVENGLSKSKTPSPGTKVNSSLSCDTTPLVCKEEEVLDNRQCTLCLKYGDDNPKNAGRLLYIGQNEWTHINCAIWSAEVFEENDGSLKNVHAAVARGRQMRCELCQKSGATVGCCLSSCHSNFHFMCARSRRCVFQDDKKMFCEKHKDLMDGEMVGADDFDVLRRVYVDFEGISFKRKFIVGLEPESIHMMIGAMKIDSLGMLSDLSACEGKLFPIGYQCSRLYWSTVDARRRCWYKCRVLENRSAATTKEPEIGEDQGTNQTIAHSPTLNSDMFLLDEHIRSNASSCLPMKPRSPLPNLGRVPPAESTLTAHVPRSFPRARIKVPNYSPSRRPLGGFSRPLPSPGSPTSVSHHILTVSDPDVVPLRRTRRHSPVSHSTTTRGRISSPNLTTCATNVRTKISPSSPVSLKGGASITAAPSSPDPSSRCRNHHHNLSTSAIANLPEIDLVMQTSTSGPQSTSYPHFSGADHSYNFKRSSTPSEMDGLQTFESPDVGAYQDLEYCDSVGSPGLLSPGGPLGSMVDDGQLVPGLCVDAFDESDMEVVSSLNVSDLEFDESVLDSTFQEDNSECHSQIVVKTRQADEFREDRSFGLGTSTSGRHHVAVNGGESSEDDNSQNCYSFSRTVVTRNMDLLPYPMDLQLPHIKQLDGVDDGTESDTSSIATSTEPRVPQVAKNISFNLAGSSQEAGATGIQTELTSAMDSKNPQASAEKVPEDLPSDIVDFVLKDFNTGTLTFSSERNHSSPTLLLPKSVSENGSNILANNLVTVPEVLSKPTKSLLHPAPVTRVETLAVAPLQSGSNFNLVNGSNGPITRREQLIASKPSEPTWLSVGCRPIDPSLTVLNLKDPPQLQRVCKPLSLSPQVPTFTMAKLETPSVSVHKPSSTSKVLMVNKQGQLFVKVQSNSAPGAPSSDQKVITCQPVPISPSPCAPVVTCSAGEQLNFHPVLGNFSNQQGNARACQRLEPTPSSSMRVMVIPQIAPCSQVVESNSRGNPRKVAPNIKKSDCELNLGGAMLTPIQKQPNLGTVILRASAPLGIVRNDAPTWTFSGPLLNVMPMLNVIRTGAPNGPGQFTIGTSTVMPQSVGLQQNCVLQRFPMNSGMMALSTGLPILRPSLLQGMSNFNLAEPPAAPLQATQSPKSNGTPPSPVVAAPVIPKPYTPIQASCVKRVSTCNSQTPSKKLKLEISPKAVQENRLQTNNVLTPSHKNNISTGQMQIKTSTEKVTWDEDDIKEEDLSDSESIASLIDLTASPKSEAETPNQENEAMMEPKSEPANDDAAESTTESVVEPPWYKYSEDLSSSDEDAPVVDDQEPRKPHPHLRFEISNEDGFNVQAESIEIAWKAVVEKVQEARGIGRLRNISFTGMSGLRMLGLHHDAVIFLVEQLFGAERCRKYKFRFHQQEQVEEELPINPSGCARSEVYIRKCTFDMFNFLASQHRMLPESCTVDEEEDEVQLKSTRRATSLELPMAMRFRHLKRTSKEAVGVYRSAIHGRGLFCKRNIDAGEMVIEYSGIVIRSVLTDKREKFYDSKGIGCYMFRIDDFDVVDATMHGNAARFINHSCEPNCYSRVIHVEGQKHIVIFALRKIYRGEELTYDYKFPIEDPSNKLPCNCGAKKCRRFLN